MTDIAETLALALKRIQKLEDAATAKKSKKSKKDDKSDEDKPKKPANDFILFVSRVRKLLKEMEMGFATVGECPQFCSALKKKNIDYKTWSNEDILEERENWEKPEKSIQLIKKESKENSAASSVAGPSKKKALPVSDAEDSFSDDESVDEPVKKVAEVKKAVEVKKAGRPKKLAEEAPKTEVKKAGRPKKAKEVEEEEYKGGLEAFKHKSKTYTKTDLHDVIDEDNGVYMGRWDEDTNEIDAKFPEPAYVKKMIAEMGSDDE